MALTLGELTVTEPVASSVGATTTTHLDLLQREAHQGRMAVSMGRGIAHELRNVAQLINMLRDEMQHQPGIGTQLMEAVTLAQSTVMRHISTLERLPPYPRTMSSVSVADSVERTLEIVRRRRRGARVMFVVETPRSLPDVMAIESELDEVLWELLTNATEAAASRGQGTVTIDATVEDDSVLLTITDDGPGIPATMRETLFNRFTTSHPGDGHLGIGLSAARKILADMGGTLTADLQVARGARFTVALTRSDAASRVLLTIR